MLLSSAPLGLLRPELSCPSPPRPRAPMALMSASSLWPCSWGVSFSAQACRSHFPTMNLLRHPGLYAQLIIQNLTRKLVLSSQLQYYYSHMCTDKYNTGMCTCLHNMHILIHVYTNTCVQLAKIVHRINPPLHTYKLNMCTHLAHTYITYTQAHTP